MFFFGSKNKDYIIKLNYIIKESDESVKSNTSDENFIDNEVTDINNHSQVDISALLEHQRNIALIANNLDQLKFLQFKKTSRAAFKHYLLDI